MTSKRPTADPYCLRLWDLEPSLVALWGLFCKSAANNSNISVILSHAIQTHVLDPALLPLLLRVGRAAVFPNNALAPPRIIPSSTEQLLIRRRCAETILSLIPVKVQDVYFGASIERRVKEVEEALNVFDDAYCNKHFLYGFVELIIVRLMPEITEKGVADLLEERLS
ncbi:hypothetical protein EG329_004380 [Mollisiaceae sp. DMI_Dod_QoI]|nr:hypothetical protein EG329_004380 [Helotiales sp. DMI_Dod_QoI]